MGPYPSDFDLFLVTAAGNSSENGTVDGFQMKGLNVNISFEVPVDDSPPPEEPETAMAGIINPSTNKTFGKSGFFNMPKGAKSSYEYNGAPQPAGASLASVEKQQKRTQSQVGLPSLLTLPSDLSSLSSPSLRTLLTLLTLFTPSSRSGEAWLRARMRQGGFLRCAAPSRTRS